MPLAWDDVRQVTVDDVTAAMAAGPPIAFSRWGDGEWLSALGCTRGHNVDGHPFAPELTTELRDVLASDPPYWLGMQRMSLCSPLLGGQLVPFLERLGLDRRPWYQNDVFQHALVRPVQAAMLPAFFAACRAAPLVVAIGPPFVARAVRDLVGGTFVPAHDAFNRRDEIFGQAYVALRHAPDRSVVLVAAGMTANLLVDRLWRWTDRRHHVIDVGSLFDPYAGVDSRSHVRKVRATGWTPPH